MKFEFLKDLRKNKILLIVFFALFTSLFTFVFSDKPIENHEDIMGSGYRENLLYSIHAIFEDPTNRSIDNTPLDLKNDFKDVRFGQTDTRLDSISLSLENMVPTDENYREYTLENYKFESKISKEIKTLLEKYSLKYPVINSEKNKDLMDDLDWNIFKLDHLVKNKEYDFYDYNSLKNSGNDAVQKLVHGNKYVFGLGQIIFFIFLYYSSYSEEREKQTLKLLFTQPNNRAKVLFSKYLTLIIGLLVYILSVLLFIGIIFLLKGIDFTGFNGLYRIYDVNNHLAYDTGLVCLLKIIFSFLSITLFFTSLSMCLGMVFSKETTLSITIVGFSILFILTRDIGILQNSINPFYDIDIFSRLYGSTSSDRLTFDIKNYKIFSDGIYPYIFIFLISGTLLLVFSRVRYEAKNIEKNIKQVSKLSLIRLEFKKILQYKGNAMYILFLFIFIIHLFISRYDRVKNYDPLMHLKGNEMRIQNLEKVYSAMLTQEFRDNFIQKPNGQGFIKESEWGDKSKEYYESELKSTERQLERSREAYNLDKEITDSYLNLDSKKFYKLMAEDIGENFMSKFYENNEFFQISGKSRNFSLDSIKKALEFETKPVMGVPFVSLYEDFNDKSKIEESVNKNMENHIEMDSYYFTYFLLKFKNLDLLLLLVALLISMYGYTTDKELGNQYELMNTQPLSKTKQFMTKVFVQLIIALIVIVITIFSVFVLGALVDGFKNYNIPVAIYFNGEYKFIMLWRYIFRIVFMLILISAFVSSLATSMSVFTRNRNKLIGGIVFAYILGLGLGRILPDKLKSLNPFSYLRANIIADNSQIVINQMTNSSFAVSIVVILSWTIVTLFIGRLIINKKEKI